MALDGLVGLWLDVIDFDCSNQGQDNFVELIVVDIDGDMSICMVNVFVIDNMVLMVVCVDVIIVLDLVGMALFVVDSFDGGFIDNCVMSFIYEVSQVAFSCDDLGEQFVMFMVSDGSLDVELGNCIVIVMVVDDVVLVVECQDVVVQFDVVGMVMLSLEVVNNGFYDNCILVLGLVLEVS